ncbi:cytochrome-c oxidase, cbb3-type subunit III [Roseobacter ponti]|uniref:Cbb3-type cytochrome c oxidase subunit n=1 Tax=Roseobacter ponti TaxID=1891787 RepID=A0A858SVH6_9RHOB|nr:cytochrome-c oxidase, cbb3-type subunit III [Roseobacter ponti]QJF52695.1 cytochrome-c oxidase, cbb3-type subunit III [Roseobacter ponti]
MTKVPPKQDGDPDTTGHTWDGIEEFDNPMPRWWLWTFYITIIWAVAYTIAYPAWPLVSSATAGILGYSTRGEVISDIAAVEEANAGINTQLAEAEITEISLNPELNSYAVSAGAAVYRTWCTQCHGSGAGGAVGYPNLLDNDWLWGGSVEAIYSTVAHGIRNEEDPDARYSEMPVFGDILEEEEIAQVANYVMTLSGGTPVDAAASQAGEAIYADNCSACHGDNGLGNNDLGAPNIADQIWLYGGDYDTLVETVTYSRYGVMPPWQQRLSEAELRAVSLYVHQLGGGE